MLASDVPRVEELGARVAGLKPGENFGARLAGESRGLQIWCQACMSEARSAVSAPDLQVEDCRSESRIATLVPGLHV